MAVFQPIFQLETSLGIAT